MGGVGGAIFIFCFRIPIDLINYYVGGVSVSTQASMAAYVFIYMYSGCSCEVKVLVLKKIYIIYFLSARACVCVRDDFVSCLIMIMNDDEIGTHT